MKISAVLREARRDVSTGTSRTLIIWVVYVALVGLLILHELFTVTGIIDQANSYQAAGANTHIIIAQGRVDGAACEALSHDYNVHSAALRSEPAKLKVTVMNAAPLDRLIATPGIAGMLEAVGPEGPAITRAGALVSEQVTDILGPGHLPLATEAGELTIAGVFPYPDDGRMTGLGFSAIFPDTVQAEPYDQCWLKSWPEHPNTLALLNSALLPANKTETQAPQITQWNTTLGTSFDGTLLFDSRISRFDPYLTLLIGAVLGFSAVRSRKLEHASARHAGVSPPALLGIQLVQQSVWILSGSVLLTGVAWLIGANYPDSTATLIGLALRSIVLGAIGALSGVSVAACTIRERSLFAYFQNRS